MTRLFGLHVLVLVATAVCLAFGRRRRRDDGSDGGGGDDRHHPDHPLPGGGHAIDWNAFESWLADQDGARLASRPQG